MPIYNSENYLRDSIGSILAQTYRDWELICVDDGSNDSSLQILLRYEDAEHETAGPDPVDPVADVVVVSEPVLSLVETGTHGPLGKLTHHHPRQRAHEPLQARA